MGKIISATGCDVVYEMLRMHNYEVLNDIPYQEGVLEIIKKEFIDSLILFSDLQGNLDKYMFIEKIREIDSKIKILVVMEKEDDNYKSFLYTKGIFDIFIDGKTPTEKLIEALNKQTNLSTQKDDLRQKNYKVSKLIEVQTKNQIKPNLVPQFQKQQIIVLTGMSSTGKSTIATQISVLISKKVKAKVLLIDFDTVNSGLNQFLGIKRVPQNPEYIMPSDKNSSLNYMIEAIDKRTFDANIFEKYIIKSKQNQNLDILTGNKSLFICEKILNNEYYSRIIEKAKELYDFIIIDTSSNVFLDANQFSLINATKILYIAEATYLSLERAVRVIKDVFPTWGVHNKKIKLIINKYHKKSLDKIIVEEIMKDNPIIGYLNFSEEYDECLNEGNPYVQNKEDEYLSILEKLEILPKRKILENVALKGFKFLKCCRGGVKC